MGIACSLLEIGRSNLIELMSRLHQIYPDERQINDKEIVAHIQSLLAVGIVKSEFANNDDEIFEITDYGREKLKKLL